MPGQNGRGLAEDLRAQRPGLRVMFMSGYTDDEVVRRGVIAQSSGFLQKPFTPAQLTKRVQAALEQETV